MRSISEKKIPLEKKCIMPADFFEVTNSIPEEVRNLVQEAIGRAFRQGRYPNDKEQKDSCYYFARDSAYYLLGKKILTLDAELAAALAENKQLKDE